MKDSLELVRALARVVREEGLAEIEYENETLKIRLVSEREAPAVPLQALAFGQAAPLPAPVPGRPQEKPAAPTLTAPLAGVFYRAPSPGASPFVQEGEKVEPGQTVCIVEAMKLMNEITAEASCRIVKALVENGKVVEPGQALFEIEYL